MGKQGHGRRLTDKERMEIIELTRQDPRIKHVELAARYKVNESTIRKWRLSANAEKIETRYGLGVEDVRDARQRGQVVRNALFDTALYEWVSAMRTENVELPPSKVREQAKALSAEFDGMQDFKASSGWYYRFCRRYGLPCPPARSTKQRDASGTSVLASALGASAPQAPNDVDGAAAPTQKRKHEDTVDGAEDERVAHLVAQRTIESPARKPQPAAAPITPATPATLVLAAAASPSVMTSPVLSVRQEVISHFLRHHKDLLSVTSRLRFIKHLAHASEEAEMYAVMDDETRIEYIKEFADKGSDGVPAGVVGESVV
ncbi:Heat shock factor protein 2 [Globisporangium polare]